MSQSYSDERRMPVWAGLVGALVVLVLLFLGLVAAATGEWGVAFIDLTLASLGIYAIVKPTRA